jgi:heme-degrading monooxygenase HmoA
MFLTLFRNRKRADLDAAAYQADNARMEELGCNAPGFVAIKTFTADDGEVLTISEWESLAAAQAWGRHAEHRAVQARGQRDYYAEYTLYSCDNPAMRRFAKDSE